MPITYKLFDAPNEEQTVRQELYEVESRHYRIRASIAALTEEIRATPTGDEKTALQAERTARVDQIRLLERKWQSIVDANPTIFPA